MLCNDKWCSKCYVLSIPLSSENDQEEIEFGKPKTQKKITTTLIYLTENQSAIQLKYFNNNGQKIKPEKAHEIDTGYDLKYFDKDTLNKTDKPFRIEHAEKIAQAIYLPLINILGLQSIKNREQLGKSERRTQGFGSIGQFTVSVNIALNTQNKFHQILQLSQPITISSFGEHHEIYTCSKPTTTQQIFESNEQICLKHEISIPNIYIPKGIKKF
ncbi:hypothetical protein G9A89_007546 [Geosiphon pyriformis]|nr:hypothetical protein G9A89_007546 [Geosiphon pyriformis]